ncbi:titin-like [Puntigrus tetrazona]|uniref:titin-like n=1 Tax=Puntigrus tetrazona TaxID=1606681 RepID=UPI001C897800|nr:titin-like [Puntigrus tetrazona]
MEARTVTVQKLARGNEYVFRVRGVNKFGAGDPLESEPIIAKNAFVTPGQPSTPEATDITKTSMQIVWNKPGVDGGSMVTGYYLERRDKRSLRWVKIYKDPISDTKAKVHHLTEGNEYQYRVCVQSIKLGKVHTQTFLTSTKLLTQLVM